MSDIEFPSLSQVQKRGINISRTAEGTDVIEEATGVLVAEFGDAIGIDNRPEPPNPRLTVLSRHQTARAVLSAPRMDSNQVLHEVAARIPEGFWEPKVSPVDRFAVYSAPWASTPIIAFNLGGDKRHRRQRNALMGIFNSVTGHRDGFGFFRPGMPIARLQDPEAIDELRSFRFASHLQVPLGRLTLSKQTNHGRLTVT